MNKLLISIAFAILSLSPIFGQSYGVSGFDQIVKEPREYRLYLNKFIRGEKRLTQRECVIAYYGFAYQNSFTTAPIDGETEMQQSIMAADFELIYAFGSRVLEKNPVSLTALYWTLAAAVQTKQKWELRNSLRTRYNNITVAIAGSGDGISPETAFRVVNPGDIYTYCWIELGIEMNEMERFLVDNRYDMFEITPSEKFNHDTIFFDTSRPTNSGN